ncbi:MAG TPA: hypothetical protein PKA00_17750 [Saprospiraceae bacterium]|nr:hypothetical protein [Saprospiraceae bacterium]HMQ84767.1 hypothetical protein [Saprospiraceae bacterium]
MMWKWGKSRLARRGRIEVADEAVFFLVFYGVIMAFPNGSIAHEARLMLVCQHEVNILDQKALKQNQGQTTGSQKSV